VRKIVHIDMDAFYASVEQRDAPQLRGQPVVVAWRGNRSVVCAASYEARKFGVRSAMPAVRAERLCPNAVFLPPDFTRYRAVSRQVREIFKRHTDLIEPLSLDEAYLDVSENKTALPTATKVAQTIREQIRTELHLTASAGVAPNKFLAKIASDWKKPDGLFVIQPEEINSFLSPLPVGRLPSVGKVTEEKLKTMAIETVADLRKLELPTLERRFGRYGVRLYELARGIDENAVIPDRPTQSISAEDTFETDVLLSEMEPMIRKLAEKTWEASRNIDEHCALPARSRRPRGNAPVPPGGRRPRQFCRTAGRRPPGCPLRMRSLSVLVSCGTSRYASGGLGSEPKQVSSAAFLSHGGIAAPCAHRIRGCATNREDPADENPDDDKTRDIAC